MLSMKQLVGVRVYKTKPASRREQKKGVDESTKRVGKVHNLVFSPDGKRVVGLMVKRPDIAGMVKRDDVFLALDSMGVIDGGLVCTRGGARGSACPWTSASSGVGWTLPRGRASCLGSSTT